MEISTPILSRPSSFTQMTEHGYRNVCVLVNLNILLSHRHFFIRMCLVNGFLTHRTNCTIYYSTNHHPVNVSSF